VRDRLCVVAPGLKAFARRRDDTGRCPGSLEFARKEVGGRTAPVRKQATQAARRARKKLG